MAIIFSIGGTVICMSVAFICYRVRVRPAARPGAFSLSLFPRWPAEVPGLQRRPGGPALRGERSLRRGRRRQRR